MKLYDFKQLSREQMKEYLNKKGVLIGKRQTEKNRYALYQCNNFYVEYEFIDNDLVNNIKSFTSTNLLKPYLDNIDISGIKKAL